MNPVDFKVRVSVRVRPSGNPDQQVVSSTDSEIKLESPLHAARKQPRKFAFDSVFGPDSTQSEIYDSVGLDLMQHAVQGYNACVFAYGQTGSGKTHTMMGTEDNLGLVPSVFKSLIEFSQKVSGTTAVTVRVSMLEVYNEQVRDLLNPRNKLRLRGTGDDCIVEGLTEVRATLVNEVRSLLETAARNRATASTNANDQSSRSHAVVSLTIKQQKIKNLDTELTQQKVSVVRLVDLAGSERVKASGASGDRLKEGTNINKSLVVLGRVISTLSQLAETPNSRALVPYRESVLTRLLQNSLSGNSRTAMIACVSPDADSYDQTLSTLRYADQAKQITTRARINEATVSAESLKEKIDTMAKELAGLKEQLKDANERPGNRSGSPHGDSHGDSHGGSHGGSQSDNFQEEVKTAALVRIYEDEMARMEVYTKMVDAQLANAESRNIRLSDYVRELSGEGLSRADVPQDSYNQVLESHSQLLNDVHDGAAQIQKFKQKWVAKLDSLTTTYN